MDDLNSSNFLGRIFTKPVKIQANESLIFEIQCLSSLHFRTDMIRISQKSNDYHRMLKSICPVTQKVVGYYSAHVSELEIYITDFKRLI